MPYSWNSLFLKPELKTRLHPISTFSHPGLISLKSKKRLLQLSHQPTSFLNGFTGRSNRMNQISS
jgi:hypothetical protein